MPAEGPIDLPGAPDGDPRHGTPPAPRPVPRPAAVPAAAPTHPSVPPPAGPPPGLGDTMEATVRVPFSPRAVFSVYRLSPAPDVSVSLINLLAWSALTFVTLLIATYVTHPEASALGLVPAALAVGTATLLAIPLGLVAALGLDVLAKLSGAKEGYSRTCQILSLTSALGSIGAVVMFVPAPLIWMLPSAWFAYSFWRGVVMLQRAPEAQATIVIGAAAAALLAGQYHFRGVIEKSARDLGNRATLYATSGLENAERGGAPAAAPPAIETRVPLPRTDYAGGGAYGASAIANPAPAPAGSPGILRDGGSGYDRGSVGMLRSGSDAAAPAPAAYPAGYPGAEALRGISGQDARTIADDMLDLVNQHMRSNPDAFRSLGPEQAAAFEKMLKNANTTRTRMDQEYGRTRRIEDPKKRAQAERMMNQFMRMLQTGKGARGGSSHGASSDGALPE